MTVAVVLGGVSLVSGRALSPAAPVIRGAGTASAIAIAGRYIVVLRDDRPGITERLLRRYGGRATARYEVTLAGFSEQQAQRLAADPAVSFVEPDPRLPPCGPEVRAEPDGSVLAGTGVRVPAGSSTVSSTVDYWRRRRR